jgi:hypothetical protein
MTLMAWAWLGLAVALTVYLVARGERRGTPRPGLLPWLALVLVLAAWCMERTE